MTGGIVCVQNPALTREQLAKIEDGAGTEIPDWPAATITAPTAQQRLNPHTSTKIRDAVCIQNA
jgi:hypothetical protein